MVVGLKEASVLKAALIRVYSGILPAASGSFWNSVKYAGTSFSNWGVTNLPYWLEG